MIHRHNVDREPPYCYGREKIIELVFDGLHCTNQPIILKGFGGIGKSTIAKKVAYRCIKENVFKIVIWLDFRKYKESQLADLNPPLM